MLGLQVWYVAASLTGFYFGTNPSQEQRMTKLRWK